MMYADRKHGSRSFRSRARQTDRPTDRPTGHCACITRDAAALLQVRADKRENFSRDLFSADSSDEIPPISR